MLGLNFKSNLHMKIWIIFCRYEKSSTFRICTSRFKSVFFRYYSIGHKEVIGKIIHACIAESFFP